MGQRIFHAGHPLFLGPICLEDCCYGEQHSFASLQGRPNVCFRQLCSAGKGGRVLPAPRIWLCILNIEGWAWWALDNNSRFPSLYPWLVWIVEFTGWLNYGLSSDNSHYVVPKPCGLFNHMFLVAEWCWRAIRMMFNSSLEARAGLSRCIVLRSAGT